MEMGSKLKILAVLSIIALHHNYVSPATADVEATTFRSSLNTFSRNIFREVVKQNAEKNIIFSPFSIQTCLAMVRMGAGGETAAELDRGLSSTKQSTQTMAANYHSMLAKYENSKILKIANKVYVTTENQLSEEYKKVLSQKFYTQAENIDFAQVETAVNTINDWVASKTDNMIKELVSPDSIDADTRLYLLSAIHFDGQWTSAFPKENTKDDIFYTVDDAVMVEMMEVESNFLFGHPDGLDAAAVRLPYKDSDLSMLILVPYDHDGFDFMERQLRTVDLPTLVKTQVNKSIPVLLRLPKFKAEFQINLTDTLKKMGMTKMFGDADFSKMLKSPESLAVTKVLHKAFIEVGEEGTKAAAVTGIDESLRAASPFYPVVADHPFYYAIINEDGVPLFEGAFMGV